MTTIVIADDHAIFRQGLMQLLKTVPDFILSGEARNGSEALKIIEEQEPDVAILDISMPEMTGIEVIRNLRKKDGKTRCILLTMHTDSQLVSEALASGAMAYLLKENAFEELVRAVYTVMEGELYISSVVNAGISTAGIPEKSRLLTLREAEILKWIVSGLTNKKIAKTLYISVKTVDTHRTRIMHKLKVHNTAEMVRYAVKNGLA